jgi:hypothetical protein
MKNRDRVMKEQQSRKVQEKQLARLQDYLRIAPFPAAPAARCVLI